eukprot:m.57699 g.57699  ORF g.57699 m.57699 type:complete len:111 (+) comp12128_c0_seq1:30-362(+)
MKSLTQHPDHGASSDSMSMGHTYAYASLQGHYSMAGAPEPTADIDANDDSLSPAYETVTLVGGAGSVFYDTAQPAEPTEGGEYVSIDNTELPLTSAHDTASLPATTESAM